MTNTTIDSNDAPDLSSMSVTDLVFLMQICGLSQDESDIVFRKACRDEIARRKPSAAVIDGANND